MHPSCFCFLLLCYSIQYPAQGKQSKRFHMKGVIFIVLHVVVYHGLYKDAVALCGFVDKHMGDGAHDPPILEDGAAAHG